MNTINDRLGIFSSLNDRELVLSNFIRQMNFKPKQALFTQRLAISKFQKSSIKISSHMVKMRWDRIDSPSEIHVVREVDVINGFKTLGN